MVRCGRLIVLGCLLWTVGCEKPPAAEPLPAFWETPAFALTDQRGERFSSEQLRGQVWAAEFFFTRCPAICPMLTQNMVRLNKALADLPADQVQLVGFSVDPEHDQGQVLAEFAAAHEAEPDRWVLLTGEQAAIWQISVAGFRLGIEAPSEPDAPITHSGKVALVDGQGMIRGFYDGLDAAAMDQLAVDFRRLVGER